MRRKALRYQEVENSVYRPSDNTTEETEVVSEGPKFYTEKGKEEFLLNGHPAVADGKNHLAYAKQDGSLYYIKSGSGKLYDPKSLYSKDKYKRIGDESVWRWTQVSPKVFELYLSYLTTGNKSHYLIASREII
jgi:hypothetical protein